MHGFICMWLPGHPETGCRGEGVEETSKSLGSVSPSPQIETSSGDPRDMLF